MKPYLPYRPYRPYLAGAGGIVPLFSDDLTDLAIDATGTFTRASTAYHQNPDGSLVSIASGAPRWAGATWNGSAWSGTSTGLLMEPARTNRITKSEDYSATPWALYHCTQAASAKNAPNGAATALVLTEVANTNSHLSYVSIAITSGVIYTFSSYVATDVSTRYFNLTINSASANNSISVRVDNATRTLSTVWAEGTVFGTVSASLVNLNNGWSRVSITFTAGATASVYPALALSNTLANPAAGAGGVQTYLGTTGSVTVWGVQMEIGTSASSYIPTAGSTVTRAVDALSYTGIAADNETRMVINAANVDIDDWNGTKATPTVPEQLSRITVYNPGERPA